MPLVERSPESRCLSYSLFSGLDIPAGEKDFVIRDSYVLPTAVDAIGVGAHAHYIGKEMTMTATLPDGQVKTLLHIKDWDFAWQDRYFFKDFVHLPRGTRLEEPVRLRETTVPVRAIVVASTIQSVHGAPLVG